MSLCIRTISNKLTPFVGTRKPITQLDRQLPKHLRETSAFLQEFLTRGSKINGHGREHVALFQSMIKPLTTSENIVSWNYKPRRQNNNWNNGQGKKESIKDVAKEFSNEICARNEKDTVFSVGDRNEALRSENDSNKQPSRNECGRPSEEQLQNIYQVLQQDLPAFFIKSIDYRIYHPDIIFENNIKGTVTKGIYYYVKQTAMLRIIGHVKFAYVKFEVLKMTMHPEDDTIKVRWRIRGVNGYKIIFTFWKYKLWNLQSAINQLDSWHDGFSTFYVNGDGLVTRHVADKMMPDQDTELSDQDKTGIAAKLALFLGLLAPREFFTGMSPLVSTSEKREKEAKC